MDIDPSELPGEVQQVLKQYPEFQLGDFNDSGANGYVMVGMQNVLRKKVAIKVYFHGESDMVHEPALLASIKHSNVLEVYDARRLNSKCSFFVMPAALNGDLLDFLKRYNLSLLFAHDLLCQLISGIVALHAAPNNLVHRDLKPANILVHDDSLLIGDFGSVRQVSPETTRAPASRHSILYCPPEAIGEDALYDYSSDVYQAGLIGFQLFGGKISENLLDHLTQREKSQLKMIEATSDHFTVSKFIDSCIHDKIQRSRLVDFSSLPCFVPKNIRRILRKSVSTTTRYSTPCEFLGDMSNVRASVPDWIVSGNSMELANWEGRDYLLCPDKSEYIVKKRKAGVKKYQKDNSLARSGSLEEAYALLKKKIKFK